MLVEATFKWDKLRTGVFGNVDLDWSVTASLDLDGRYAKNIGANPLERYLPFYLRLSIFAHYGLPVSAAVIYRRTGIGQKDVSVAAAHLPADAFHDPWCPWRPH